MHFIQTLTNVIVVAIRNRQLAKESLRQEGMKKELELAAEMQAILVPHSLPKNKDLELAAVYRPHHQVGGDYYDFMDLGDGRFMMCMGDVSGKGVSAAFLMANFQAYLRAIFTYKNLELKEVIHELNTRVMHSAMGEKYITFFIAVYDKNTRLLEYVNCGHNPPVVCFADGSTELLGLGSIGLGMFDVIPSVQKGILHLEPESMVICYTDGLVELENEEKEEYGVERLRRIVSAHSKDSISELNEFIIETVNAYRGSMPFVDDTALLSCRFC
jgi:sigma-B regulation protein RsbU (phosphoserine phosphatase)